MQRRTFLTSAVASGVAAVSASSGLAQEQAACATGKFKLKYAPHFGAFRAHAGKDPIDHLKFMADQGFRAFFDNGLMGKPAAQQEKIGVVSRDLGLDIGPFVMFTSWGKATMVTRKQEVRDDLKARIGKAIDTAKRTGCKWALIAPGDCSQKLEWDYQTANLIDNLRFCVDLVEASGLILVIEPLNWWANHPGLFLQKIPQAYMICRAVNSPYCKIVNDLYHQQITEGNLIPNINMAWDEIAAFHLGDNPGRKEPTSGEINYLNIFRHLYRKGYDGVLCMEHGNSHGKGKDAEKALIKAYCACDDFEV